MSLNDGQNSQTLYALDFDFNIPSDAIITGVLVEIEKSAATADRIKDNTVRLIVSSSSTGDNKALDEFWGTTDEYSSYGGEDDTWGVNLTPSIVNSNNFGVGISAIKPGDEDAGVQARVDHIRMTVYYFIAEHQGPNAPANAATAARAGADANWTNVDNIKASDNSRATVTVDDNGDTSNYLQGTGFNFDIPAGATIHGIELRIERSEAQGTDDIRDDVVQLVKGGTIVGNNKASSSEWPTSDATATYGGPGDLWGTTWTASDINDSQFGFVLSVERDGLTIGSGLARVDFASITVYYFIPNSPPEAESAVVTTYKDTPVQFKLNATDAEGDPFTFSIVDEPSNGEVEILDENTGEAQYTPDAGFEGTDSFTFKAGDSSPATITIQVVENTDIDGDGVPNNEDNCPTIPNTLQDDNDHDGIGNLCDETPNGDGGSVNQVVAQEYADKISDKIQEIIDNLPIDDPKKTATVDPNDLIPELNLSGTLLPNGETLQYETLSDLQPYISPTLAWAFHMAGIDWNSLSPEQQAWLYVQVVLL